MSKKIRTSSLTDETYYRMSQRAYNYDYLKKKLRNNDYIRINSSISNPTYWYVDRIKSDDDTGLDAVVLVQAEKKNGKWVKSKNPENVVVSFAGTDLGKDPINDGVKADGSNVVLVAIQKKKPIILLKRAQRTTLKH